MPDGLDSEPQAEQRHVTAKHQWPQLMVWAAPPPNRRLERFVVIFLVGPGVGSQLDLRREVARTSVAPGLDRLALDGGMTED